MSRITPEQVLQAYAKTGLRPMQKEYARRVERFQCGCALTACAVAAGVPFDEILDARPARAIIMKALGLTWDYVAAFTDGFDVGGQCSADNYETYKAGYDDGAAAAAAVFG
jgi:hypothetical protein